MESALNIYDNMQYASPRLDRSQPRFFERAVRKINTRYELNIIDGFGEWFVVWVFYKALCVASCVSNLEVIQSTWNVYGECTCDTYLFSLAKRMLKVVFLV